MTDLTELAKRVEALDGPCRETDAEIAKAIGWKVLYDAADPSDRIPYYQPDPDRSWTAVPLYTFSLDAAMTLVETGARRIEFGTHGDGSAWAYVYTAAADKTGESEGAANEAAAITAAALRARAAMGEG